MIYKDKKSLLSLKASRWTIQLTMAVQLNKAFNEILHKHKDKYDEIVVGVYYGTNEGLTDKYDILRGINRGARHDVIDLTENVKVLAGKEFWRWLNDGEEETQRWLLEGILKGLNNAESRAECSKLLETFTASFNERYKQYIDADGKVNWAQLLTDISG